MRYSLNSNSLQSLLSTFKAVWMTNRALHPDLRSYADGPARWMDEVIAANEATILLAKINEFNIRTRHMQLRSERLDVES